MTELNLAELSQNRVNIILKESLKTITDLGKGSTPAGFSALLDQDSKSNEPHKAVFGEGLTIDDINPGDIAIINSKHPSQDNPNTLKSVMILDIDNSNGKQEVFATDGKGFLPLSIEEIILLLPKEHRVVKQKSLYAKLREENPLY